MKKKNVIVVVSGGINSALITSMVSEKFNPYFLHVSFGHKVEKRELKAFKDLAAYYKVKKRLVANVKYLKEMGGSSLTDRDVNVAKFKSFGNAKSSVPTSYVPFLNNHLISIAISWAETLGVDKVFFGANEGGGLNYPDSTKKYFSAFSRLINEGTKGESSISLETPLIGMTKGQIIKKAQELEVPLNMTWTCYKNNDIACGECDACVRRLKGFTDAKEHDPLEYMVYLKL